MEGCVERDENKDDGNAMTSAEKYNVAEKTPLKNLLMVHNACACVIDTALLPPCDTPCYQANAYAKTA